MSLFKFAKEVVGFVFRIKFNYKVMGLENIPTGRGFIMASNHVSIVDPLVLAIKCKKDIHFMAKVELFKNPIFGLLLKSLKTFPVSRGSGDNTAIETAIDIVKSGEVLGIFPEGTRSKTGELQRAKSGAILIASQTGGDILPVSIKYKKSGCFRTTAYVNYGKVIPNSDIQVSPHNISELKICNKRMMQDIQTLLDNCDKDDKIS